jgi:hypothetical protein
MPHGFARHAAAGAHPLGRDPASVRQRLETMEHILEGLVRVPGTNRRLGLDVILDFVPVVGDTVAAGLGAWLVWEARNLKMIKRYLDRHHPNTAVIDG